MCEALKILGYIDTYHGFKLIDRPADGEIWDEIVDKKYKKKEQIDRKDLDRLLGDCAAITDMPAVMLWRELIASYPEVSQFSPSTSVTSTLERSNKYPAL